MTTLYMYILYITTYIYKKDQMNCMLDGVCPKEFQYGTEYPHVYIHMLPITRREIKRRGYPLREIKRRGCPISPAKGDGTHAPLI